MTWGVQLGIAGEYPLRTVTRIDMTEGFSTLGALVLPTFGWMVEKNVMIGGQIITGHLIDKYSSLNYIFPGPGPAPIIRETKMQDRYTELGISPFARYYVPLNKRNIVNLYLQAGVMVYHSTERRISRPVNHQIFPPTDQSEGRWNMLGGIGVGVSVNGKAGNLDMYVNNTGLYFGYYRHIVRKK